MYHGVLMENKTSEDGINILSEEDSIIDRCQKLDENKTNIEVNWSALPDLILSLVSYKTANFKSYIRFGAVCTSWRGIYHEKKELVSRVRLLRDPVLLMLAGEHDGDGQTGGLYSFSEKRLSNEFSLQIPHNLYCAGSSHGWLVTVSEDFEVSLINPFLSVNDRIQLPSLPNYGEIFYDNIRLLNKAILSADPISDPNYTVIAIYGGIQNVYFWKPGDKAWTHFDPDWPVEFLGGYLVSDIIYDEDKFYALDRFGRIFVFNVDDPSSTQLIARLDTDDDQGKSYLVKSGRDLLRVVRNIETRDEDEDYYFTDRFSVFKVEPSTCSWTEVKSLGERILFLGINYSVSLPASEMPGCTPNCIYFTDDHDDYCGDNHDMGVFNLEDGSIQPHYPIESRRVFPCPVTIHLQATRTHISF